MNEENNNIHHADPEDTQKNNIISMLAALIDILFFLPLVAAKDSELGRFYANYSLVLLLANVAAFFVGGIAFCIFMIPVLGWVLAPLLWLVCLAVGITSFVFRIIGAINAYKGIMKPIPYLEKLKILNK